MRIRCAVPVLVSVVTAAVLLAFVPAAAGLIEHHGSGTYNYPPETTAANEHVKAWDTTKVNVLIGGSLGNDLNAYDDSTVTVSGGSVEHDLYPYNNATVNVIGGTIGGFLGANDNSTVTVSGGEIGYDLNAYGNATVTVSGGSVGGAIIARDNSTLTFSGGSVWNTLDAYGNATMTIIGSGFNFAYGDYFDGGPLDVHSLIGTLADGTPISTSVYILNSATVTLAAPVAAVPEPATAALVLLGAGGLICRRRAA